MASFGKRKSFLSPDALEKAVRYVMACADGEGISVALVGGFALQLVGSDRLTGDVDMVSSAPISALNEEEPLSFGGYRAKTSEGIPVDLILRDDEFRDLYEEALLFSIEIEGLPVVKPEYLVAMKMVASRPKDDMDLEFLLGEDIVDLEKTRDIVRKHLGPYAVRELNALLEEAHWRRGRGEE